MKAFTATKRDNQRHVMRLELSADDVETLEALIERVDILARIEDSMGVVAIRHLENTPPVIRRAGDLWAKAA